MDLNELDALRPSIRWKQMHSANPSSPCVTHTYNAWETFGTVTEGMHPKEENTNSPPPMCLWEDSPARTSPVPESNKASKKESEVGCGENLSALLARYDLSTCLWKTLQPSASAANRQEPTSDEFLETWPRSGMMRNGIAYPLPALVRLTREIASSLWPTPKASEGEHGGPHGSQKGKPSLTALARMWPTPQGRDYRSGDAPDSPRAVRKQHQEWTPNLNDLVLWNTSTAHDAQSASLPPAMAKHHSGVPAQEYAPSQQGNLNPDWVEQLMGFPLGWTNSFVPNSGLLAHQETSENGKLHESLRDALALRNVQTE